MTKKVPLRQCVGCREMKPKSDLVRVVKDPQGGIQLDTNGKLPGRGAYLCKEEQCIKKCLKSKALERGLSSSIPTEIYDHLTVSMENLKQEVITS